MKIALLDSFRSNPGDLDWEPLEKLGDFVRYEQDPCADIVARASGVEVVLVNKAVLSRETIYSLDDLRYIGSLATGYDNIDIDAARERGIIVTNVPAYSTESVAQMVFAHILVHFQHIRDHDMTVHQGKWSRCTNFCYWDYPLIELSGQTMGMVGFGQIGRATARIATAFGMKVIAYNRSNIDNIPVGVEMVGLEQVFSDSDIVSIQCQLTSETEKLVNQQLLSLMKKNALLINTSRGGLIDEQALADVLNNDKIAGAGLDVLSNEPPSVDDPLLSAKNCIITPHIAWATKAARQRCLAAAADNITAFVAGKSVNVVNV